MQTKKTSSIMESIVAEHFRKCYIGKLIIEQTKAIIGHWILRQINLQEIESIAELKTERMFMKIF